MTELTQNGAADSISDLAIKAGELCQQKKLLKAQDLLGQMLNLVSGKDDGDLCLAVHRSIEQKTKELEQNQKPLNKLMNCIAEEVSSIRRWKLVVSSKQFVSEREFNLILAMDSVKSIKSRIKSEIGYPAGEPVYGNAISKKMPIKKRQPNKLPEMKTYASQLC